MSKLTSALRSESKGWNIRADVECPKTDPIPRIKQAQERILSPDRQKPVLVSAPTTFKA